MKKFLITLLTIISLMVIIGIFQNVAFAANYNYSSTLKDIGIWKNSGADIENKTRNVAGAVITIIKVVGTGVSILILIYIAIMYMIKAPSEKAEFKKTMTAYIVGAIILFTATNLVSMIIDFADANITAPKWWNNELNIGGLHKDEEKDCNKINMFYDNFKFCIL